MRENGRATRVRNSRTNHDTIEASSGNVFADLAFGDAKARLLKAELATKIGQLVKKKGWSRAQTAKRLGMDQSEVSRLLRGQLSSFSAARLFILLKQLSQSVDVRISEENRSPVKSNKQVIG